MQKERNFAWPTPPILSRPMSQMASHQVCHFPYFLSEFSLSFLFFPLGEEAMALSASEIHWDSDDEENNEDLLVLHAFLSISFLCFSTFSQIKLSDGKNTFKLPIF